jgi:creatinine amidohydrolase
LPWLHDLTSPEAEVAFREASMAVWPVGSTEQHGPHLAVATDAAIAEAFATPLIEALGTRAIGLPPLRVGLSEHHLEFPGTLTLRPATYLALIADVVESVAHAGLSRLLIVNGHGGNIDALRLAARSARRDHGMAVASVMWSQIAADVARSIAVSPTYGHACETETSLVLALAPELVRRDRLAPVGVRRATTAETMPPASTVDQPHWFRAWTADGALGDPSAASLDAGRRLFDAALRRMVAFAQHFAREAVPEPAPGPAQAGG